MRVCRSEYPKDVVHIPFLLEGVAGLAEFNQADGIHPNEQGAQKIAEALYPKLRDLVDQLARRRRRRLIELTDVSRTVTSGAGPLTILHPTSFEIARGRAVAITGPSGSGKSTLLGLIAGLDAPSSGIIRLDGVAITSLGEDALARLRGEKIGIVFQFFHLLPSLTAYENVLVPMEIAGVANPQRTRTGAAGGRRPLRARPSLSVAALRRRAAARGHCPGARQRSADRAGR